VFITLACFIPLRHHHCACAILFFFSACLSILNILLCHAAYSAGRFYSWYYSLLYLCRALGGGIMWFWRL
jgi:hypothetical protein